MKSWTASRTLIGAVVGLASGFSVLTEAHSQSAVDTIADNDSIFVDGKTFKVTPGKAKGDSSAQIKALGARDLGPGAVIFRSGEKLYIVDAPLLLSSRDPAGQNVYLKAEAARPNRIRIEYEPPKDPKHQMLYETLKQNRVLETLQQIFSPVKLPVDLTIKTKGCDGLSVFWYDTPNSMPTVTLCYELIQEIVQGAPTETTPAGAAPRDAIVGQFFFWTTHEIGHAMFDIFQIPLFGREEDAADQFAGYIILQFGKDQARRLFAGAAYAAHALVEKYKENPIVERTLQKYASVHGLPEQRFYNMLCLAYGADPVTFADAVENGHLPKSRAGHCEYEYQSFKHAWAIEMSPHIDREMARSVLNTAWLPQSSAQPVPR